jgi:hypothetical protein
MDRIEEAENAGWLILIVVVAYAAWKIYDSFTNKTQCGANGGQPCCTSADMSAGNCISPADGSACGWWEFLTATTCYEGTPQQTPLQAAEANSSATGGAVAAIGSLFTGYDTAPGAMTPGLPAGYNPATGTIQ